MLPPKLVLCLASKLNFPMVVIEKGFFRARTFNIISEFLNKCSKSYLDWTGDVQKTTKLDVLSVILSSKC